MRLPDATPPTPELYTFDVLIAQNLGLPATGATVRAQPTGGSEWQVVILAEALAARGFRVGVTSPVGMFQRHNGVTYIPISELHGREDAYKNFRPSARISTEVLVSERFGQLPWNVDFERLVFDLHDLPDDRLQSVMGLLGEVETSRVVVHSKFLADLLQEWPRLSVIPCMLPDDFYTQPKLERVKLKEREHHYVYASAAMKGLAPTLALWRELKRSRNYHFRKAKLTVCSPGYDQMDMNLFTGLESSVGIYTGLSPAGTQQLLAASDGIFMVSQFPETFGIVFHQCELAGKPAHVLQTHGELDALHTTLAQPGTIYTEAAAFVASFEGDAWDIPMRSFAVSQHIDQWIAVLGLYKTKEQAA